jgi:hypothetical protein
MTKFLEEPKPAVDRSNRICLTGNTQHIRPILIILLEKHGFKVTGHPAKGIRGLICGDAHTPSRAVTTHQKYIRAVKNGVPVITIDSLPTLLSSTED